MDNNKILQTEHMSSSYVIIADRDGVRKYLSRNFPSTFQYTIKINKAKQFSTKERAKEFMNMFETIKKPEVREIHRHTRLV